MAPRPDRQNEGGQPWPTRKARQGSVTPNSGEVPALTPQAEEFPIKHVHDLFSSRGTPADVQRGYAKPGEHKKASRSKAPTPGSRQVWTEPHESQPGKGKPFGG